MSRPEPNERDLVLEAERRKNDARHRALNEIEVKLRQALQFSGISGHAAQRIREAIAISIRAQTGRFE